MGEIESFTKKKGKWDVEDAARTERFRMSIRKDEKLIYEEEY